jgi:hypothetical protein
VIIVDVTESDGEPAPGQPMTLGAAADTAPQ